MGLNNHANTIGLIARIAVIGWIIAQIAAIIYYWGAPQYSDAANYARFAGEALNAGSIYPTSEQFHHNDWIANTGYVNFLVLNLYVFGNLNFVGIEQLLFNCLLLWSLRKLCRRYSDEPTSDIAVIIFCLLPSNTFDVAAHMSDLLCCALFIWSIAMMRRNIGRLIIAGAIASLANWVRPVGLIYWPSVAILGWIACRHDRVPRRHVFSLTAAYVVGVIAVNAIIGGATFNSCGTPLTGSTTKGTNMIIGCNDLATGDYNDAVFKPGNAGDLGIDHYDAAERDKELTARSIGWILAKPGKFLSLAPKKIFRLWCGDFYTDKVLDNPADGGSTMAEIGILSMTYYAALLLALIGIWKLRRQLWGYAGAIMLPLLLGTGMHLLMYGGMRYHYPMMPVIYFFAATGTGALLAYSSRKRFQGKK